MIRAIRPSSSDITQTAALALDNIGLLQERVRDPLSRSSDYTILAIVNLAALEVCATSHSEERILQFRSYFQPIVQERSDLE